jgi:oxygen-independent coproporphyrinogen-3 oxidase
MPSPYDSEPRSAYIHVPFCVHRCGYCDFTLVARRDDLIGAYLDAMEIELARLERPREVDTLFFGGGTPTHLPAPQLEQLMSLVQRWLAPAAGAEICVEANPAAFDDAKIAVLAEAGVNRISLGVQSFDSGVLELLERDHRGPEIADVVERVRRRIPNLGLDLIFGVPGQTVELWHSTLATALTLQPTHLSTYGLTFEKGTAFKSRLDRGQLQRCDEEREREMYGLAMDELPRAGFEQYELSNFARAGFRCRHNEVYWSGRPFFGFGPGAARYSAGRRELNHRSVTTWINRVLAGQCPIAESEELSPEARARELIMLNLRRCVGLDEVQFREQTGFDFRQLAGESLPKHLQQGLLEEVDGCIRLSREGRFLADTVFAEYV